MHLTGNLFVISAPSGTGKTSLVNALIELTSHMTVSISHTTRPKRSKEVHGVNYYFVNENEFKKMIDHGDFLEYATIFQHLYGTSFSWVQKSLSQGIDVILEIDWQGCQQIKRQFPNCIRIFILPPSLKDLEERLTIRNQDNPTVIQSRLADAKETISHIHEFDYVVINADFDKAANDLKTIVEASRLLLKPQMIRFEEILKEFIYPAK